MMAWGKRSSFNLERGPVRVAAWACVALLVVPCMGARAQTTAPAASPSSAQPAQTPAKAKRQPPKPAANAAAPKKDPAVAQQQIEDGVAALQAGKADVAVQRLSAAISGGGLATQQLARALYHRGLAYRKQSKPALAISDLTQALYLKNGLVDADRTDALANRSAAYSDAGLPDQEESDAPKATIAAATARAPTTAPAPVAAAKSSSGGGIGGFFGDLFGSSKSASPVPAPPAPTKPEAATSAWSSATEVQPGTANAPKAAKTAAPPAPSSAAKLPGQQGAAATTTGSIVQASAVGGRYAIQVAQLRTREEAEAVAARIKQQFGGDLGDRQASIVAISQGGFGTLHRVTFGPFADASEWKPICPKLISAKHDCQPVTQ